MLDLITPVNDVFRRDVEVSDTSILDPTDSTALEQGEWVARDTTGKVVRVTAVTTKVPMQVWSQKGDMAVQALGKVTVLQLHQYEAETDMYKTDDTYAVGSELTVDDNTIDGVTRSCLELAASSGVVHAICTKPPQDNGGKLRFQKITPYVKP